MATVLYGLMYLNQQQQDIYNAENQGELRLHQISNSAARQQLIRYCHPPKTLVVAQLLLNDNRCDL